jgi:hypothetical protein
MAPPARAQTYDVVGLVIDAVKGEPIPAVRVETKSGKLLGMTKSNGRFEVTVNSSSAVLVFKRHTYKDVELDLAEKTELVDIEVSMESAVIELTDKDTESRRGSGREAFGAHSMEELEKFQAMRIDLSDHLRSLPGVSGMNEFTNDISVWGSRTNDVTHYLGQSRIPSLRHLDFGYPGNQSVLNPRLLRSISVADNPARGPTLQGNASALVYDLKEGDPNNLNADLVFGTVNRELNMSGYWEGRTFLLSGRYLEPTFLSNLGKKFYTEPKEARLRRAGLPGCTPDLPCKNLEDPLSFRSGDLYAGTYYRDSTGAFGRHSLIVLDDWYEVQQDLSRSVQETDVQTLVNGVQDAWLYTYEGMSPLQGGDLSYALSVLTRNREEAFHDTIPVEEDPRDGLEWYPTSGGVRDNLLGKSDVQDLQTNLSFQWDANSRLWNAAWGYGLDLEYLGQTRDYRDIAEFNVPKVIPQDYALANGLFRLRWTLGSGTAGGRTSAVDAALGGALVYQGLVDGEDPGIQGAAPLASLRYTRPYARALDVFGELALRQNTALEPRGYNRVEARTTSSVEAKVGTGGPLGDDFQFTSSVYSRLYSEPLLPVPEVHWNYAETRVSDYAYVSGVNATFAWTPSHHFGMGMNGSVVQGDYHLEDGEFLPWEANRTLDLVTHFRFLPRRDSLLSFILTYTANNGAPLYEYTGLYDPARTGSGHTGARTVQMSRDWETVSRQRTDIRVNLDLPSRWRPLSNFRFFFEADNIFADATEPYLEWLGGGNERRRGWSRAFPNGDLRPVVTNDIKLFILFGFERKLVI